MKKSDWLRGIFACVTTLLIFCPPAAADDWPAWKGPNRDSQCKETGLLRDWPEDGPPLAWKTTGIGEGYGGPAIVGKVLYVTGHKDGNQYVFALDIGNQGKQIWASNFGPVRHDGTGFPGARSTPTFDGDRLYVLGIAGDLVCMDAKDGRIVWQKDIVKEFGGTTPRWGFAESPLIDGPRLICTPGGKENTILALNKTDGSKVWGSPVGDDASYASVIKAKLAGVDQYVNLTMSKRIKDADGKETTKHGGVIGVDAKTGKFLWRYDAPSNKDAVCSTCVISGDSVFAASAYNTGGGKAEITKNGDQFNAKEVFFEKKMQNHHGGMILKDGYLYGCGNPKNLLCLDYKTGEIKWTDTSSGKCSLLYADGMLYCRDENGPISLVEAAPQGFKLHGRFKQPERSDKNSWPHLVIANGMMYVRDQGLLLVYDVRAKK